MGRKIFLALLVCLLACASAAAPKTHVIGLGRWTTVKWPDATGKKMLDMKVRPLMVDARVKEYTTGAAHDVTERLFVVRRAFRVNDALPAETAARWQWQRGGWLLVDRVTARVAQLNLPEFDPFYSTASWYRDYVAYCGVSEDGKKLSAVVMQVGRRKPVIKKTLGEARGGDDPDSECAAPSWERSPMRVTFLLEGNQKVAFSIRGRVVDVIDDNEEATEE